MAKDKTAVAEETKPEQTVKVEDAGPALKRISVELPESRIKEKIESMYVELRDDAVLPGFRRGRAPRRLLEKRFKSSMSGQLKSQLLSESYTQAIEDEGLDVIGEPDVKDIDKLEVPEKGVMKYVVEVEVAPKVELPAFDKIKVNKPVFEVTDADVDAEIEPYRERFGKPKTIEDGKSEEGDYLSTDVTVLAGENAKDDAEKLLEAPDTYVLVTGKKRDYKGHVAGIVVDDLGKLMKGKKPGDTETISMTGPAGHENEKIKGQPITIKIAIKKIERIDPAPIEDLPGLMGVESVDDLKARIKQMLEQRHEQNQRADMHKQVAEYLTENVELELPKGVTGRQTARVLQRQQMELAYRGVPEDEIAQKIAEMREGSEEEAIRQLKLFFILDQAAKDLEVEVQENEINGRIAMMAYQQGRRPEKLRQEMHKRGQIEQLYLQVREQKVMDQIIEKASVTEVKGEAKSKEGDDKPAAKKTTKKKTTKKKAD
ncbi:MAG: trigger factor [Phycisphaerales bacterium]